MLKLDLTGHSSHVSFSRNILSSSSRALRGSEEKKKLVKKKKRVEKVKRRCGHLSITDLVLFCVMRRLLCSEIPN